MGNNELICFTLKQECAHALTLLKEKEAALKEGISVLEDLRQENKSLRMQLSDLQQEIKENEVMRMPFECENIVTTT